MQQTRFVILQQNLASTSEQQFQNTTPVLWSNDCTSLQPAKTNLQGLTGGYMHVYR